MKRAKDLIRSRIDTNKSIHYFFFFFFFVLYSLLNWTERETTSNLLFVRDHCNIGVKESFKLRLKEKLQLFTFKVLSFVVYITYYKRKKCEFTFVLLYIQSFLLSTFDYFYFSLRWNKVQKSVRSFSEQYRNNILQENVKNIFYWIKKLKIHKKMTISHRWSSNKDLSTFCWKEKNE